MKSGSSRSVRNLRLCYLTGRLCFFQYVHVPIHVLEKVTPELKFKCRHNFQHEHGKIKTTKKPHILGKYQMNFSPKFLPFLEAYFICIYQEVIIKCTTEILQINHVTSSILKTVC